MQTLYQEGNKQNQAIWQELADAGAGEAIKMGATELGDQSGIPGGKAIGSLVGAALQATYNNRTEIINTIAEKANALRDDEADTGVGERRDL